MELCEQPVTDSCSLIPQISAQLCQCFGQSGIDVMVVDRSGETASGSAEALELFHSDGKLFGDICGRIDDGDEPVIAEVASAAIVGAALHTGSTFLGYIFVVLYASEKRSVLAHIDIIEVVIRQAELIAGMVHQRALEQSSFLCYGNELAEMTVLSVN